MKEPVSRFILLISVLALALPVVAQQQENHTANSSPLALLLQSKGILSAPEVAMINQALSPEEANARLAELLMEKGLISRQEYSATVAPVSMDSPTVRLSNAVLHTQSPAQSGQTTGTPPPKEPVGIPAVAPLRVLPIDVPKQSGMIPDIHLGSGANMKVYGFFKASAIEDTASSGGPTFGDQDWPLPLLIGGDTGPTSGAQFHIKARSFRVGSQFEWVPKNSNMTITGKVEADFEGDYTDVSNRNISAARSSQFGIRLAYMRLDTKLGGTLPWFAEFGQDWSLVSSSLPSIYETTGTAIGMGALWERVPMFKTGVQFQSGNVKIQPEFAIVLPVAGSALLSDEQRARFGDRAGAESNQPGLESRIVLQFPLSHNWQAVAPAQLIVSGHHARINEIIPAISLSAAVVPGSTGCATPPCSLLSTFPHGVQAGNPQNIWTAEAQLPTPWVTWVTKYYRGDDMRFPFGGQLNDVFTDLNGATSVGSALSFTSKSVPFGCLGGTAAPINCNGNPITVGSLRPIRGQGGFSELSFPLSRIFHADPGGHNAGWSLHLMYGTDRANAADTRRPGGNGLVRTDLDTASLTYKVNSWMSIIHEVSYIDTRAANRGGKTFRGIPATQAHSWRNEFGTIFTF